MEDDGVDGFGDHPAAVDFDEVVGADLGRRVETFVAIDFDVAFLNHGVAGTAGANSAGGEKFV